MKTFRTTTLAVLGLALAPFAPVHAQTGGSPPKQSLEQAASDPTASLMSVQIQDIYTGDYHRLVDESGNTVQLRAALPFKAGGLNNIARVTLPIVTSSPSGESGLGDLTVFDVVVFDQPWGRWAAGAVMLAPTGADRLSAKKWAIGPAIGFVARSEKILWGVFNQNTFTVAGDDDREDVNVSFIQPILNYQLPGKWSLGFSEMSFTYDWERNAWTNLPLGAKLAKVVKLGKLPVQFSGAYEYNFADGYVVPKWSVNFTAKFLFPL